eukprot:TRINITY_DN1809_c1_g2_i1.p2 TRINITY_DN1809_c1_g2~~TRINITY_DN1809_c1_g2_i1.p2  ORF type:complete len:574 (+),score=147.43 TRINITY_DN1809_c1_g2_i1:2072-3793(+)
MRQATFMELYHAYITNYEKSQQALYVCKKKSKSFHSIMKAMDLATLLTAPTKRIVEYASYFEALSATSSEKEAQIALRCMERLRHLRELADAARFSHQTQKVLKSITGWTETTPGKQRRFVMQGTYASKEHPDLQLLLFSDTLIFAKKLGRLQLQKKYQYVSSISLRSGVTISDVPDVSPMLKNCLQISDTTTTNIVVSAKTEQDKSTLFSNVSELLKLHQQNKVFGVHLANLMQSAREEGRDIPHIVEDTTAMLEQCALEEEGIFRLSASSKVVEQIHNQIDCGEEVSFEGMNCHVVAGVLKLFIRSLPEPLLTFPLYDKFKSCTEFSDAHERLARVREAVNALPALNAATLQHLTRLLWLVSKKSSVGKMNSINLSVVFAPHLMRPEGDNDWGIAEDSSGYVVVQALIDNYEVLFEDIEKKRQQEAESSQFNKTPQLSATVSAVPSSAGTAAGRVLPNRMNRASCLTISLQEIVKQGFLTKKGGNRHNWTQRWFVLKMKYLYYFQSPKERIPKGVICLQGAKVHKEQVGVNNVKREHCWCIDVGKRQYLIACKTDEEVDAWVTAVGSCCVE